MAAQNSGGQRGQRQESGNEKGNKSSGGQRGVRQEAVNDNSSKNSAEKKEKSGNNHPRKEK